jgi:hypothetical protein
MNANDERSQIAIYYEHPEWFKPLFAELEHRGVPYAPLLASELMYDPTAQSVPYDLIVNRMSPSAYTRGNSHAIFSSLYYLAHLKDIGANVLNGFEAYLNEISKATQLTLLESLGLRHPAARVINRASLAPQAAEGLTFPVIIKPNIGGSGAKITRFDTMDELVAAGEIGNLDLGIDQTALIQEFLPAADDSIVRVEVMDGKFLYAIRLFLTEGEFNLCPADYCLPTFPDVQEEDGINESTSGRGDLIETYRPPDEVISDVLHIASAAKLDIGGVEYLVNERDGEVYYYDINALSNFVADAPNVIGFDPFPRFVDFILRRAGIQTIENA